MGDTITDLHTIKKSLHESEELYRSLGENIHLGITLIDTNHRIVMTNVAQGNFFNKPNSEFVGKRIAGCQVKDGNHKIQSLTH